MNWWKTRRQFSGRNLFVTIPNLVVGFGALVAIGFFVYALVQQEPIFSRLSEAGDDAQQLQTTLKVIVGLASASVILLVSYYISTWFPMKETIDKLGESDVFIGTSQLYGEASRNRLLHGNYASLDLFAPTALWNPDFDKKQWLKTVVDKADKGLKYGLFTDFHETKNSGA